MNATDKIVFILGAGCSCHAGLPLLTNFFEKAEALKSGNPYDQHPPSGYVQSLEKVNQYRLQLKKSNSEIDIHNIESVYEEALKESSGIINDLNQILIGVLDMGGCTLHYQNKSYQPDEVYQIFAKNLYQDKDRISIISFNWDCYLDYALYYYGYPIDYFSHTNTGINLFKIHGSLHFGRCRKCDHAPQVIPPNEKIGTRLGVVRMKDVRFDLRLVSEILGKSKCSKCGEGPLDPIIVPPLIDKQFEVLLKDVLGEAKKALSEANKLHFVGYSFPNSDEYFINFMDEALSENVHVRTVNIINPDAKKIADRYYDNLKCKKHHLQINSIPMTFKDFVSQMDQTINNAH